MLFRYDNFVFTSLPLKHKAPSPDGSGILSCRLVPKDERQGRYSGQQEIAPKK